MDRRLRVVSDRHRRWVIRHLRHDATGAATVEDLVDALHSPQLDPDTDGASDRDRILVALVHTHLPKLDDLGVVTYDRDLDTVRYRPDETVEEILDALPEPVTVEPVEAM